MDKKNISSEKKDASKDAVNEAHTQAEKDIEKDSELNLEPKPADDLDEGELAKFEAED